MTTQEIVDAHNKERRASKDIWLLSNYRHDTGYSIFIKSYNTWTQRVTSRRDASGSMDLNAGQWKAELTELIEQVTQ